jgi:hypothetical protein
VIREYPAIAVLSNAFIYRKGRKVFIPYIRIPQRAQSFASFAFFKK